MKLLRKKRFFVGLLLIFLLLLFYNTDLLGRWMYPIKYEKDIQVSAANYKVDPLFIAAIIRVESNYKPEMLSKKGAIGLMQIMPDTAQWIVEQAEFSHLTKDRLNNPDVNIEVGSWYIHSLTSEFRSLLQQGSKMDRIAIIAASYNAGPGNVAKWVSESVWNGKFDSLNQIPFGETRHYVQRIVYYYKKYERYYSGYFAEATKKVPDEQLTAVHPTLSAIQ